MRLDNGLSRELEKIKNTDPSFIPHAKTVFNTIYDIAASKSKDPSTQTAALLSHGIHEGVYSTGFNRLPFGIDESVLHTKEKYEYIIHAEVAAINNYIAEYGKYSLSECILTSPWFSCIGCARHIVDNGIKTVVGHKQLFVFAEKVAKQKADWNDRWDQSIHDAFDLFEKHNVKYGVIDIELDLKTPILVGGELFYGS